MRNGKDPTYHTTITQKECDMRFGGSSRIVDRNTSGGQNTIHTRQHHEFSMENMMMKESKASSSNRASMPCLNVARQEAAAGDNKRAMEDKNEEPQSQSQNFHQPSSPTEETTTGTQKIGKHDHGL